MSTKCRADSVRTLHLGIVILWALFLPAQTAQAVTLTVEANNGSVVVTPRKDRYEKGEVVELLTRPESGFSFAGWSGDAQGKRLVINLTMTEDKHVTAHFQRWQPPIGIPEPPFGIHETHRMYEGKTYAYAAGPGPYRDAGDGPYTHYVDARHPRASDEGNPYGTRDRPRESLPSPASVQPGAVIELHGGPYGRNQQITYNGTASRPVFLRGPTRKPHPIIHGRIKVSGHFLVVENLDMNRDRENTSALGVGPLTGQEEVHHVSIRNCEIHNYQKGNGRHTAVMGQGAHKGEPKPENIVFYNNHLHPDCMIPPGAEFERDLDGISLGINCNHVWVVDNHIHHLPGDCVGGAHRAAHSITNYYIGRNIMHDSSENAIDLKEADGVIISENLMYNFARHDGTALVVHYGGNGLSTKNVWILHNEIHSAIGIGIQIGGGQEHDVYIVGNVIHNIRSGVVAPYLFASFESDPALIFSRLLAKGYVDREGNVSRQFTGFDAEFRSWFPGDEQVPLMEAILLKVLKGNRPAVGYRTWNSRNVYLVGNTFYNLDSGIESHVNKSGSRLILHNTIVSHVGEGGYHLSLDGREHMTMSALSHNLFYQPGTQATVVWGGTPFGVAQWQRTTGKGEGSLEADPQFVNPLAVDFGLRATSPAIDAGDAHVIYQIYEDRHGKGIRVDQRGLARPQGLTWDIGALEYGGVGRETRGVPKPESVWVGPSGHADLNGPAFASTSARRAADPKSSNPRSVNRSREESAPLLRSIGDRRALVNTLLKFSVSALDPEAKSLVYSAQNLPDGARFTIFDQVFSWKPTADQVGRHQVTFSASNGRGESRETITIEVTHPLKR